MTTSLVAALAALQLDREMAVVLDGTWATLQGEGFRVYVAEAQGGAIYFTWCDDLREQTVQVYHDPRAAIMAGLKRAADPARPMRLGP